MCGIVFLHGPEALLRMPKCLARMRHRGPDDQAVWSEGNTALGFVRLAINGSSESGRQPWEFKGEVAAINGEIYNYRELVDTHGLEAGDCDTRVVLPLLAEFGPRVIDLLDGFYAAVVLSVAGDTLLCLRDHIGKKPLFVGRSGGELFVLSELKALDTVDWFEPLPLGVSKVDLTTGEVTLLSQHKMMQPQEPLLALMQEAVRKRMPNKDQPVGVFLSGGIDSSIIAAMVSQLRQDVIYYTLGDEGSPDRQAVEVVVDTLGLSNWRVIPVPSAERMAELLSELVYATESYNPSVVSNGVAAYLLAEAANADGVKVVLTGEGADELFGGYHHFSASDPWDETRAQLIQDMPVTELRRLDRSTMAHSVEARCPFLDRRVLAFSEQLSYQEMYDGGQNKICLRRSFLGILPEQVLQRAKTSFDVGSGLRGQVVQYLKRNGRSEREELKVMWESQFNFHSSEPYFHHYPVFDAAIDRRGVAHR